MKHLPALLLMSLVAPYASGQGVYSVCQLLQNPIEHSGEVVRVRGVLAQVPSAIADPGCREMPSFHKESWEPGLLISSTPPATADASAMNALAVRSKQAAAVGGVVRATFEGVLKYCPAELSHHNVTVWWGCGTPGYYPLELAVRTVSDLIVEPNPFAGTGMALPPRDPNVDFWLDIRAAVISPERPGYFLEFCKGAQFPYLTGKLVSASPTPGPTTLVLAIAGGNTHSNAPDAILNLDGPLPGQAPPGTLITFGGVAETFTSDPFTLTFSVDRSHVRGWTVQGPAARAPAGRAH